jgi:hypothetical protein
MVALGFVRATSIPLHTFIPSGTKPFMVSNSRSISQSTSSSIPMLNGKSAQSCHITVPDLPKPVGAIAHVGKYYSYFRCYDHVASVQRVAARLITRGDLVVLTQVRKGLILWVFEPDAKLAGTLRR